MDDKRYTIAGREFYQAKLVYGQLQQLRKRLAGYSLSGMTADVVMTLLIDEIPGLLAIVLIPIGYSQADKVLAGRKAVEELEEWFTVHMSLDDAMPVVKDFFALNHAANLTRGMEELLTVGQEMSGVGSTITSRS